MTQMWLKTLHQYEAVTVNESLVYTQRRWLKYRGRLQCLVLPISVRATWEASEAGCFREVAALYSDHYKQVSM